jgi:hypothetical protein
LGTVLQNHLCSSARRSSDERTSTRWRNHQNSQVFQLLPSHMHPSYSHGTPPLPSPLSLTAPMVQSLDVHMLSVNMLLYPNRATISATVVLQLRSPSVWRWPVPRPTSCRRGCCTLRMNPSFSVWQRHLSAYHLSRMLLYP